MGRNKSMSDELKALAALSLGAEARGSLSDAAEVTENAERQLGAPDSVEGDASTTAGSAEPVTDRVEAAFKHRA
jgi:hypothetical protein